MSRRADIGIGVGLGLGFFALYLTTLCPTVFWYDSAEYATAAAVLGIPHPPGYPLYTLIGHLFTLLPMEPGAAVNLMSAVFAATAVGLTYGLLREMGADRLGAAVGAATLGAGRLFWSQAVIAEVYTPGAAALTGVTWLVLRGRNQGRDRLIVLGAFLAGLSLGLHLSIATCGLGLALLVASRGTKSLGQLFSRHQLASRARLALACLAATAAGSLIFLYLPLRARMHPALNFGDPESWKQFKWVVTGGNYKNWFGGIDLGERLAGIAGLFYDQLLVVGLALAAAGAASAARRNASLALALALMIAGNLYAFYDYRVHDFEVFLLLSIVVTTWLVGLGASEIRRQAAARLSPERARLQLAVAAVLLAFPLLLVPANYGDVDLSGFDDAERFAQTLIDELPKDAVIINFTTPPEWKLNAVFGFYYQRVKGARPDVRVTERAPSPRAVIDLLDRGVPVYVYYPVEAMVRLFQVVPDGPLYRVVAPRGRPK